MVHIIRPTVRISAFLPTKKVRGEGREGEMKGRREEGGRNGGREGGTEGRRGGRNGGKEGGKEK